MLKGGELRQVVVVPAGHALHAEKEHRKVKGVKAGKEHEERPVGAPRVVHTARHLGEPVVEPGGEGEARAPELYVVEVADDEVCVVQVQVHGESAEHQPGKPPYGEEKDKGESVKER